MAELSQPSDHQANQAALAEREAAGAALQSQADGAAGSRGDSSASQIPGSRGIEFNPANEALGGQAAGAAVAADLHGGGQAGGVPGSSGVAGLTGSEQWESFTDAARGLGYEFPADVAGDDQQALLHVLNLARRNQEADYYAQLGRQLAPHYQGIQGYLQQQAQPKPAEAKPDWESPEFDQQWLNLVQRDPQSGVFLAKPGVNPVIADKVNSYDRWFQKYGNNPVAAVKPYLQKELPSMLGELINQKFGEFQRQQTINTIVQRNADWMYQQTPEGRTSIGVGGQPVPTPAGMRYGQLVGQLERGGMGDPVMVDQLARNLLMGEMAMGQLKGAQGQAPAAQRNQALASGRAQSNPLQSLSPQQRQGTPGATDPDQAGLSLAERLRGAFEEAGFSDADFQNLDYSGS